MRLSVRLEITSFEIGQILYTVLGVGNRENKALISR